MKGVSEYRDGNGFIAEIIRTNRRKTASIRVEEGAVSVVVPASISVEKIDQLLVSKRLWIKEKMALQRALAPVTDKQFVSGEAFPYLGRNYRLKVEQGSFVPVKLLQGQLVVQTPEGSQQPHMIRNALVRWYKRQASQKIKEKVKRYAPMIGVEPLRVTIKTFSSRWGSCTAKGEIEFNWRIMLAPNRMVDYVVVHELCHLIHHDHSPDFWQEMSKIIPDFQVCRQWLKENSERLKI
ncbi:M48 family metallopeptidase [Paenalcaligenes hominis]|uniref:M48 family metallopeptidase n=1 Tax=Paenalcaligenes hominis TaxID=643674 RepID=UPI0035269218